MSVYARVYLQLYGKLLLDVEEVNADESQWFYWELQNKKQNYIK